jgi:hypothetical protein
VRYWKRVQSQFLVLLKCFDINTLRYTHFLSAAGGSVKPASGPHLVLRLSSTLLLPLVLIH